jgi:hypothetical protein
MLLVIMLAIGDLRWTAHWYPTRFAGIHVAAGRLMIDVDREGRFKQRWHFRRAYDDLNDAIEAWFREPWLPGCADVGRYYAVWVPIWVPFLAFAGPTVYLWSRDRRPAPGHCPNCGYDLTGNVSGVCPECGQKVAPMSHSGGVK